VVRESEALGEGEFAIMQLAVAGGGNLSRASRGERERERYILNSVIGERPYASAACMAMWCLN